MVYVYVGHKHGCMRMGACVMCVGQNVIIPHMRVTEKFTYAALDMATSVVYNNLIRD